MDMASVREIKRRRDGIRSTEQIKKDNPDLPAYETYDALLSAIERVIGSEA